MKNAIILHGKPSKAEYENSDVVMPYENHWLGWLQKQLSAKGIYAVNPDVAEPYNPQYQLWVDAIEALQSPIDKQSTLVGHSCGAGFWLRYLAERPELEIEKLVLVAPWIDRSKYPDFFDFTIDPELQVRVIGGIAVFNSLDDSPVIQHTVAEITDALPKVTVHEYTNKGHFTRGDMGTQEFPELLDEIIGVR